MYNITDWNDHVTDPSNVFTVTDVEGNKKKIERAGSIIQQGTPMSALNFNNLETGVLAAYTAAVEAMLTSGKIKDTSQVTVIRDYLKNSLNYPFNDSSKTIALNGANERTNTDYQVYVELDENPPNYGKGTTTQVPIRRQTPGYSCNNIFLTGKSKTTGVGDIIVYDKMTNGFKVAFTGSAINVHIILYVVGGR